jgi:hypothetical protein
MQQSTGRTALRGPCSWYKTLGFCTTSAIATPVKRGRRRYSLGAKLTEFTRIFEFHHRGTDEESLIDDFHSN